MPRPGVKDSTGDVGRVTLERLRIAKPFTFLSGETGLRWAISRTVVQVAFP